MRNYLNRKENILSVGLDIGTSTTKIIFSRFSLTNTAGMSHIPRIEIVEKEVLYKSQIHRTPFYSQTLIDMDAVVAIVRQEYEQAGIHPQDIQTGAVIITGETATKQNAEEILHLLSNEAGEFVVATAGPDLEGMIAAKGSGAYQYSKKTGKVIANIDIGGGTSNLAVYEDGEFRGTCTLHIGGRLIEFEGNRIKSISPPIEKLLKQNGWKHETGDTIIKEEIRRITDAMVSTLVNILNGKVEEKDKVLLLGHHPDWEKPIDEIMFSGGVCECIYQLERGDQALPQNEYHDIGVDLAEALRNSHELQQWPWVTPNETVRATVLGAGTQTTEISGATIQVEHSRLPLKNLPVFHLDMEFDLHVGEQKVKEAVQQGIRTFDPNKEGQNFALYLSGLPVLKFYEVQQLAQWLVNAFQLLPNRTVPMVIVIASDFAKVIGQSIKALKYERDLVCIDQIIVEHGEYLDIGNKLNSDVVPVVVKTLAFQS